MQTAPEHNGKRGRVWARRDDGRFGVTVPENATLNSRATAIYVKPGNLRVLPNYYTTQFLSDLLQFRLIKLHQPHLESPEKIKLVRGGFYYTTMDCSEEKNPMRWRPRFSVPRFAKSVEELPFEIRPAFSQRFFGREKEGLGVGIFAKRDLKKGEVLFTERPLLEFDSVIDLTKNFPRNPDTFLEAQGELETDVEARHFFLSPAGLWVGEGAVPAGKGTGKLPVDGVPTGKENAALTSW